MKMPVNETTVNTFFVQLQHFIALSNGNTACPATDTDVSKKETA